jgi:hypothetical protein
VNERHRLTRRQCFWIILGKGFDLRRCSHDGAAGAQKRGRTKGVLRECRSGEKPREIKYSETERVGQRVLPLLDRPEIAIQLSALLGVTAGQADLPVRQAELERRRYQAGAEAVPAEQLGILTNRLAMSFDDARDGAIADPFCADLTARVTARNSGDPSESPALATQSRTARGESPGRATALLVVRAR